MDDEEWKSQNPEYSAAQQYDDFADNTIRDRLLNDNNNKQIREGNHNASCETRWWYVGIPDCVFLVAYNAPTSAVDSFLIPKPRVQRRRRRTQFLVFNLQTTRTLWNERTRVKTNNNCNTHTLKC